MIYLDVHPINRPEQKSSGSPKPKRCFMLLRSGHALGFSVSLEYPRQVKDICKHFEDLLSTVGPSSTDATEVWPGSTVFLGNASHAVP